LTTLDMNSQKPHPVTATFDSLIALRAHIHTNPSDVAARFVNICAANLLQSNAQLFQDLFVIFFLNGKRNGFFVEFGATNGIDLSNTFLLERHFEWKGILAEPAHCWHNALKTNRRASIDLRCVWAQSGHALEFKETKIPELSTVSNLTEKDFNRDGRKDGKSYIVESVSLNDLLTFHKSPQVIDYLSVDTEGSEFAILEKFDFAKFDVNIITVEHNFCDPDRKNIHDLLTAKGFVRLFEFLSKWDDWYIKRSLIIA
jgi:FkbM family methyltransferase